jgi:hypothetical protein
LGEFKYKCFFLLGFFFFGEGAGWARRPANSLGNLSARGEEIKNEEKKKENKKGGNIPLHPQCFCSHLV